MLCVILGAPQPSWHTCVCALPNLIPCTWAQSLSHCSGSTGFAWATQTQSERHIPAAAAISMTGRWILVPTLKWRILWKQFSISFLSVCFSLCPDLSPWCCNHLALLQIWCNPGSHSQIKCLAIWPMSYTWFPMLKAICVTWQCLRGFVKSLSKVPLANPLHRPACWMESCRDICLPPWFFHHGRAPLKLCYDGYLRFASHQLFLAQFGQTGGFKYSQGGRSQLSSITVCVPLRSCKL